MKRTLVVVGLILLSTGAGVAQEPQRTTATYADWIVRCVVHSKAKTCEMAQITEMKGRSQPLTQIAIGQRAKNGKLKVVFEVPVNVWLPDGVKLTTGKQKADITASFSRCVPVGCFAETDVGANEIKALRSLKENGKLQFKDARKQPIAVPVSFKGFAAAFDALEK